MNPRSSPRLSALISAMLRPPSCEAQRLGPQPGAVAHRAHPGDEETLHQTAGALVVAAQGPFHRGDRVVVVDRQLHLPPVAARGQRHLPPDRLAVQHDVALQRMPRQVRAGAGHRPGPRRVSVRGELVRYGPLSRRSDCMMANVVVYVNSSMSAAASTPVYLAMTGAAAPGDRVQVALDPEPDIRPGVHVVRNRIDRRQGLPRAGLDVGDVLLVHRDVIAGGEPAYVPGDQVRPGVGQRDVRGPHVADHVLAQVGVVDGHPAGVDDIDEHERVVVGEVDVDVVRRVVGAVPGQLDPLAAHLQRVGVGERHLRAGRAGSSSRSSSRRVSSCPILTTSPNSEDRPRGRRGGGSRPGGSPGC